MMGLVLRAWFARCALSRAGFVILLYCTEAGLGWVSPLPEGQGWVSYPAVWSLGWVCYPAAVCTSVVDLRVGFVIPLLEAGLGLLCRMLCIH